MGRDAVAGLVNWFPVSEVVQVFEGFGLASLAVNEKLRLTSKACNDHFWSLERQLFPMCVSQVPWLSISVSSLLWVVAHSLVVD